MEFYHQPVMLDECIELLALKSDGTYVDCTVGGGGHSAAIAARLAAKGRLLGIDQDDEALAAAARRLQDFGDRVVLKKSNFVHLDRVCKEVGITGADGFLFDLGVSSHQVDEADRGFSYQQEALLDMRMDAAQELTARQLVNRYSAEDLARIIKEYGEERWAERIAKFIVEAREIEEITTTTKLVEVIKKAIPAGARRSGPHPAKRTFQALRIAVNNELGIIAEAVNKAVNLLIPGGRIVIISFHSLEDRIVKRALKDLAGSCHCPPDFPVCKCNARREVRIITGKARTPSAKELAINPRARSAKVRAAERL